MWKHYNVPSHRVQVIENPPKSSSSNLTIVDFHQSRKRRNPRVITLFAVIPSAKSKSLWRFNRNPSILEIRKSVPLSSCIYLICDVSLED